MAFENKPYKQDKKKYIYVQWNPDLVFPHLVNILSGPGQSPIK
jgi:hypothetical protein